MIQGVKTKYKSLFGSYEKFLNDTAAGKELKSRTSNVL
jgi:hypothetical protein